MKLTAERRNGSVDGLDEHAFTMQLKEMRWLADARIWWAVPWLVLLQFRGESGTAFGPLGRAGFVCTSSQVLVSNKIQPNSITSAESLVT